MINGDVDLLLPSVDEVLTFNVHIVVEAKWPGGEPPPPEMLGIARAGITQRAERLSRRHTVTAAERLRDALSAALFRWHHVPGTEVLARGHCTSVDVDPQVVAAIAEREEVASHRFATSWQDERRAHQAEQMRSQLLDPLRAAAWWFLDNQDKPERVAEIARAFQEARDILAPENTPDSPGLLVDEMIRTSGPIAGNYLLNILRKVFAEHHRDDLQQRLEKCDGDVGETGRS